jgi:hypothetical protein
MARPARQARQLAPCVTATTKFAAEPLFMPACYPGRRERDEQDWRVVEVVTDIAPGLGCSPAQVGLARVMRQPAVATTTIVGVTTVEQLKVNLAAGEIASMPTRCRCLIPPAGDHSDSLTGSAQTLRRNRRGTGRRRLPPSRVLSMRIRLRQGFSPGGVGEVGLVHQAA